MRSFKRCIVYVFLVTAICISSVNVLIAKSLQEDLENARKAGKTVFLVVTDAGTDFVKAKLLAVQANRHVMESLVYILDRSKMDNTLLVNKFKLAQAAVPSILVIGLQRSGGGTIYHG